MKNGIKQMYNIPKNNLTKVKSLTKECCYYLAGECTALECDCVVMKDDERINCLWYIGSVLPLDKVLQEKVFLENGIGKEIKYHTKKCKSCGSTFKTVTKNKLLCDACTKKNNKERKKAYKIRQTGK